MPTFTGFYNMPFNITPGSSASTDMFRDFDFAYDALLNMYAPQFTGSTFYDFLAGGGRNLARQQFQSRQAADLAAGGNIYDAIMPEQFLKQWNPTQMYGSFSPQDRGERGSSAFSPFVRFRT